MKIYKLIGVKIEIILILQTGNDKIVAVIQMILSISQLAKSYGDTPILKNITFKVEARDKLAIIGVNGAGKTTLFRIPVFRGLHHESLEEVNYPLKLCR